MNYTDERGDFMLKFDPYSYHFNSRRRSVYAKHGMVASSHPLASEAGLRMLEKGGNAIDACVAMAMILPIVEPAATTFGSDNFAIVWAKDKLHGMSSSGWSPYKLTEEYIKSKCYEGNIPAGGWDSTTVPGCFSGLIKLLKEFGTMSLAEVAEPAIQAAEEGHPITPYVQGSFKWRRDSMKNRLTEDQLKTFDDEFFPGGKTPEPGQLVKHPNMARLLREIVETNGDTLYKGGKLAQAIVAESHKNGGLWEMEDFVGFEPVMHEPLRVKYHGYEICELPPNGQGITALIALGILDKYHFDPTSFSDPRTKHLQMEAIKLAFADAKKYVGDPGYMPKGICEKLLSEKYMNHRRSLIDETIAQDFKAGNPDECDTCYFCAADTKGNMISMIQSCFGPFGSMCTIPGYGLVMQSRGATFTIEDGHINNAGPHKRPYQTIIPAFLMKDGKPVGPFGVMGGFMQPQGHMQVAMNMIDFHMNPQDALDAPRFCWSAGKKFDMESHFNPATVEALAFMGHQLTLQDAYTGAYCDRPFGRGQIILLTDENTLVGGTDPRGDGCIIGL